MDKKRRVKIDFSKPVENIPEDPNDKNIFIDNSAEEIRQLREHMMRRRQEEMNHEDEDGIQINVKPVQPQSNFERIRRLLKV